MKWTSVDEQLPETQQRVLVGFKNSNGYYWVTCAEYIAPKSVLEAEHSDERYINEVEYDEEKSCYWLLEGWYEYNYEPDTNWMLHQKVTHWMELPQAPETLGESLCSI